MQDASSVDRRDREDRSRIAGVVEYVKKKKATMRIIE